MIQLQKFNLQNANFVALESIYMMVHIGVTSSSHISMNIWTVVPRDRPD